MNQLLKPVKSTEAAAPAESAKLPKPKAEACMNKVCATEDRMVDDISDIAFR